MSSNRRVIPDARSPREAIMVLTRLRGLPGHVLWADDVSVVDCPEVEMPALDGYRPLTDAHPIALAVRRGGSLVTFDRAAADLAARNERAVTLLGS